MVLLFTPTVNIIFKLYKIIFRHNQTVVFDEKKKKINYLQIITAVTASNSVSEVSGSILFLHPDP